MKANSKLFSKGREYEIKEFGNIKILEYRHHIFDPGAEFQIIFAKEIRRISKVYDYSTKRNIVLNDKNYHSPSYYSLVIKDGRIIKHRYSSPFDHQELMDKLNEKDSFELVNSMCFDHPLFNIINQARLSKTSNPHIRKLLLLM